MDLVSNNIPKSALILYVKLYCQRKTRRNNKRHKSRNTLVEATQSWLTLSEKEKQQFIDKHKEYVTKYRHLFANYLKNAEPYLKKKDRRRSRNDADTVKDNTNEPPPMECESQENSSLDAPVSPVTAANKEDSSRPASEIEVEPLQNQQNTDEPQEYYGCELSEPAPPSLKSSKDLFEAIKAMDEQIDSTWDSLSRAEKSRYQFALRSIKNEYINKYKAYLESLPSNKLFDHYTKVL